MPPRFFNYYELWIELIYSLIIVVSCMIIYLRTKELYELTSYKGIKYFRNTFLFFGITYAIRFLLHLSRTLRINPLLIRQFGIFEFSFFIMVYASTMALVYLIYSIFWKSIDRYFHGKMYIFHLIALLISFISALLSTPIIHLILQTVLFVMLIIISYYSYKKTHKVGISQVYLLYFLIFSFWLAAEVLEVVSLFSPAIALITYVISIVLFLIILLRVLKKVNNRIK